MIVTLYTIRIIRIIKCDIMRLYLPVINLFSGKRLGNEVCYNVFKFFKMFGLNPSLSAVLTVMLVCLLDSVILSHSTLSTASLSQCDLIPWSAHKTMRVWLRNFRDQTLAFITWPAMSLLFFR